MILNLSPDLEVKPAESDPLQNEVGDISMVSKVAEQHCPVDIRK